MKVLDCSIKASGSNLVAYYVFTNGYTAEQWQPANPYSGACLLVYTPKGFFVADTVTAKAAKAITKYHS
jgi:hypothetical protein